MPRRPHLVPAVLSLLLPGLGQLFQSRYPKAIGFFTLFAAVGWKLPHSRWLIPFIALAAGWEAFQEEKHLMAIGAAEKSIEKRRYYSFAAVAVVGAVSWLFYVGTFFLPIGSFLEIEGDANRIAAWVRACREHRAQYPLTLAECGSPPPEKQYRPLDPWGGAYEYSTRSDGFEIRSWGRDKRRNTEDDFVFRFQ